MAFQTIRNIDAYTAKMFFFILYAENSYPWIKRQSNRFSIDARALQRKTTKYRSSLISLFERMQTYGWIYNLRCDNLYYRFYVNLPSYLTFSDSSYETESLVQPYVASAPTRYIPTDKPVSVDPPRPPSHMPDLEIEE